VAPGQAPAPLVLTADHLRAQLRGRFDVHPVTPAVSPPACPLRLPNARAAYESVTAATYEGQPAAVLVHATDPGQAEGGQAGSPEAGGSTLHEVDVVLCDTGLPIRTVRVRLPAR
jgi:hypothetical protein